MTVVSTFHPVVRGAHRVFYGLHVMGGLPADEGLTAVAATGALLLLMVTGFVACWWERARLRSGRTRPAPGDAETRSTTLYSIHL